MTRATVPERPEASGRAPRARLRGRRPADAPAWTLFFPLAALHAAITVPLSLLALYHHWPVATLASPAGHARELLFGFALAVIAGYLLGPLPRRWRWGLAALWVAGRLGGLDAALALPASLADGLFALGVAWRVVPRFLAAKKWRNRMLAPLLGLICLLAGASLLVRELSAGGVLPILLRHSALWLVLLMVFMGGRIIAPAVNGHLLRRYRQAGAGVQPRLEAALIVLLGALALVMPWSELRPLAAALAWGAATLVLWRLWRWTPWRCRTRRDLLALLAGYAWLSLGLGLLGLAWWRGEHAGAALHAVTVGALGTLSSTVMLRQAVLRAKAPPEAEGTLALLAGLFAGAAGLRLAVPAAGAQGLALLWGATLLWSLAWLLVAARLAFWIARRPVRPVET